MAPHPHEAIHNRMTEVMDNARLRPLHWRIWWLSAMGIFLDGFDLFIIGVALPLIIKTFSPSPYMVGLIGASALLGAVVGAAIGGPLTDKLGRRSIYLIDLLIFIVLSVSSAFSWSVGSLILFRFLLGIGIGADYPICASYISAFMPVRLRGRMLIGAFSFQAIGMAAAAFFGLVILKVFPSLTAWRYMLAFGAIPAVVVLIFRAGIPESARWHLSRGNHKEAARIIGMLLPEHKQEVLDLAHTAPVIPVVFKVEKTQYRALFSRKYFRRTILTTVPWFLMDMATYGVGIFTPIILAAMALSGQGLDTIASDFKATEGALFLDIFLIAGFLLNILLVDKWGRIRLQLLGFGGMALGLLLLALSSLLGSGTRFNLLFILAGFATFNLMMNLGPNATTFILPAELYPTKLRGTGHGFSSAVAKIGAACGIFLLPVLKDALGLTYTLILLAIFTILAFMTTLLCRIETKGRSLEDISRML